MNKKKKLLSVILCAALVFALAVPAFAAVTPSDARRIYAWGGRYADGSAAALNGNGLNNTVTVRNNANGGGNYWCVTPDSRGGYTIKDNGNGYYINIRRVLQPNGYYLCTEYYLESATEGRDQRVGIIHSNGTSMIYLFNPLVSGSWYLMTDRTNPAPTSDVIWYQYQSASKARWM